MNADGGIDIGDPVYLLSFLFSQGPAPEPICSPGDLPDTGQTTCYDGSFPIDCATGPCFGQDGYYDSGCPSVGRFVDNLDGTVTDHCTGLMWQKDPGNGGIWCDALAHCWNLVLGTDPAGGQYFDWRLPNVRELQSIVDYGTSQPAIDPIFGAGPTTGYWSSSSKTGGFDAWFVSFFDGGSFPLSKSQVLLVRAVRSVP